MNTITEYTKKLLLPKTREEEEKWAIYFYEFEPLVRNFVDGLFEPFERQPTITELTNIVKPFFKMLCYRSHCKLQKELPNDESVEANSL